MAPCKFVPQSLAPIPLSEKVAVAFMMITTICEFFGEVSRGFWHREECFRRSVGWMISPGGNKGMKNILISTVDGTGPLPQSLVVPAAEVIGFVAGYTVKP